MAYLVTMTICFARVLNEQDEEIADLILLIARVITMIVRLSLVTWEIRLNYLAKNKTTEIKLDETNGSTMIDGNEGKTGAQTPGRTRTTTMYYRDGTVVEDDNSTEGPDLKDSLFL